MGRYYNGSIEGKFWVAVQSSDDASFFGGEERQLEILEYLFGEDDLDDIKKGISTCIKELGEYKDKLDLFFEENNGYNNNMLKEYLDVRDIDITELLEWYARLELGEKILRCVEKEGFCEFEAEL